MVDHDFACKVALLLQVRNCPIFQSSFAIYAILDDGEAAFNTELIHYVKKIQNELDISKTPIDVKEKCYMIYRIISKLPDLKKTKINTDTLADFPDKKLMDVIHLAGLPKEYAESLQKK